MANTLNLDQLSEAMRAQQEGRSNGKKVVWDKTTMRFIEQDSNETASDDQSVVNDVSQRPFFCV